MSGLDGVENRGATPPPRSLPPQSKKKNCAPPPLQVGGLPKGHQCCPFFAAFLGPRVLVDGHTRLLCS